MTTDVSQIKRTTSKIKNIQKKTANDENAMNQDAKNQKIKMKFHVTDEISCYDQTIKWACWFDENMKNFFDFQKNVSVDTIRYSYSWRVIYI